MEKKLQQNRDATEALRLQQEELDAELALLLERKEDGASSHSRRQERSPGNQSRTFRPDDSQRIVSKRQSRLLKRSRHRSRSQERSRHISRSQERSRHRSHSTEIISKDRFERRRRETSLDQKNKGSRKTPSQRSKTEELARRLAEVEQKLTSSNPVEGTSVNSSSLFFPKIDREQDDPNKKAPHIEGYDGLGDPYEHIQAYDQLMHYYNYSDVAKCQIFYYDSEERSPVMDDIISPEFNFLVERTLR